MSRTVLSTGVNPTPAATAPTAARVESPPANGPGGAVGLEAAAAQAPAPLLTSSKFEAVAPTPVPPPVSDAHRAERDVSIGGIQLRRGDHCLFAHAPGDQPIEVEIIAIRGNRVEVRALNASRTETQQVELGGASSLTTLAHPARVEIVRNAPVLQINGQRIDRGDGMRLGYWASEDDFADRWVQVRDVGVRADGSPRVLVDEWLRPGRTRLRELKPHELIGAARNDDIVSYVRSVLKPIPEMVVVRRGQDGISTFRRGEDEFSKGDRVRFVPNGATAVGGRILSVHSGTGGSPEVLVRLDDGRGEKLHGAVLSTLTLDRVALAARAPERDPWPAFEVVRIEGKGPVAVVQGQIFDPGAINRYNRGTPGYFPVKIERIDDDDRVFIKELIPVGTEPATLGKLEIQDKEYLARAAGPFEPLVRAITVQDDYLFHPMPGGAELKYHVFDFQDLDWAITRANTGKLYSGQDTFYVRGEAIEPGDAVVYRRGGQELSLKLIGVEAGQIVVEGSGEDPQKARRTLEKADWPFLFPPASPTAVLDGAPARRVKNPTLAEHGSLVDAALKKAGSSARALTADFNVSPRTLKTLVANEAALSRFLAHAMLETHGQSAPASGITPEKSAKLDLDWVYSDTVGVLAPYLGTKAHDDPEIARAIHGLGQVVTSCSSEFRELSAVDPSSGDAYRAVIGLSEYVGRVRLLVLRTPAMRAREPG